MNMSVGSSSVKKGETLIDTAMTLNAMRPDILIIRHQSAGAAALLAQKVGCSVVNAGDGAHEHPTQALLDALTIRRAKGRSRADVAICGDILHSRVARSNIILLNALGARCASSRRRRCCRRASPTWASRSPHRWPKG
jgi:aspartate carbamoyltransferase catalytic subunit